MTRRAAELVRVGRAALALGWRAGPGTLVARVALALLAAGALPLAAVLSKLLVDELAKGTQAQAGTVTLLAVLGALVGVLVVLLNQLAGYLATRHEAAVTLRAEDNLFGRVCEFTGLRYFEDPEFQNRLLFAENSAAQGPASAVTFAQNVVRSIATLLGFLGIVAVIWPVMAVLLVAAAVPGLVAELRLAARSAGDTRRSATLERRRLFYRTLLTDDAAAKEVRLYGLGRFLRTRQLRALRGSQQIMVRLARRTAAVQSVLSVLAAGIAGLGTVVVAGRVTTGQLTPGDVLLFVAAVGGMQNALAQLVGEIGEASRSLRLFQGYLEVMGAPPDLDSGGAPVPQLRHELRFDGVWFRYGDAGPWVLRGVNFVVPAGTSLGLVGVNGAGKSTLIKLVCRFYDPDRGRILWDGVDLRTFDPALLRARLAATFQDFMAYQLSAAENIGVGDLAGAEPDRIKQAARLAGVDTAISALPKGYDTMLSRMFVSESNADAGALLSGGQWQRVAIARSLMRGDADLLILDEPSSNLDAAAEHEVHLMLRRFRRGRTSLLISHRLGSIREADQIVVLDGGVITERGDHETLLRSGGTYARLFNTQAEGYQPAGLLT